MRPIHIMIVEDEALVAMHQMMDLTADGFVLCGWVGSGEEAVELAREKEPDAALMDIRLTGKMDGIDALAQIRAFSKMPVVFVTGYNDDQLRERAMALQPAAYLVKPVDTRDIAAALRKMIDEASTRSESNP